MDIPLGGCVLELWQIDCEKYKISAALPSLKLGLSCLLHLGYTSNLITAMDTVLVLAISLGGLLIIIGLWGLWHSIPRVYDIPIFYFLRTLAYPLIIQRQYWGSLTRIDAVVLFGYITGNAICMYQRNTADLMVRTGKLAVVNMVLLFVSGRTSLIADKAGIPLHSYYLAHHWVGRMFIAQGIIHAVLGLLNTDDKHKSSGIVVSISLLLFYL